MRINENTGKNHPYKRRTWFRSRLPWFITKLGIAAKGNDCEIVQAEHHWYNIDGKTNGCYHCEKVQERRQE
ncbi:MAG: hypothetical protein AB8B72_12965 [Crocinitomicaceae bacterium]